MPEPPDGADDSPGESRAGTPAATSAVAEDEAIRISTGAAVPTGATAVIPQEEVTVDGDMIETLADSPAGQHVRARRRGHARRLAAADRRHPAGRDRSRSRGYRRRRGPDGATRPRVSVVCAPATSCGRPASRSGPGEIHNSNAPMLVGLAAARAAPLPAPATRLPTIAPPPRPGSQQALEHADVVIISGGVSVGPHDHVKPALAALGVRGDLLERLAAAGQADLVRAGRRTARWCSGCPATRSRRSSPSRCSWPPRWPRCRARPAPRPPRRPRRRSARGVRRNPRRDQAIRVRLELRCRRPDRVSQRRSGLAHHQLAGRRRRAGDDPRG